MRKQYRILIMGIILFLGGLLPLMAQQVSVIRQKVLDENGQGLPDVTIELLKASDSSFIMARLTDSSGIARFSNLKPGAYFTRASRVGFTGQLGKLFEFPGSDFLQLPDVQLQPGN